MSSAPSIPLEKRETSPGDQSYSAKAYAAQSPHSGMAAFSVPRRGLQPHDVKVAIRYCGVCHTDIHWSRNDWSDSIPAVYPLVPGHEIVGIVTSTGPAVEKFKPGDSVGIGCMVDSCRTCANCLNGEEQYCASVPVLTYNSPDKHLGGMTFGGYSESIVVDEAFVLRIPEKMDLAAAAPLLCAGITTYAPFRHHDIQRGQKVGIVGLGGLGHMGLKFAAALGTHAAVFTTSPGKAADALRLGAGEVIVSTNPDEMQKHAGSFDFILDTVAVQHDVNSYINLLKIDGTLALVGASATPLSFSAMGLLFGRRQIAGSLIGGIRQTQEMLDFCGDHGIVADIELIRIQQINEAFERILKADVKYRFVIDMASLQD